LESGTYRRIERVFLCDGDALIIPQKRLVQIMELIRVNIRGVKRVGTYANAKSVLRKTRDELTELKELGMGIIYLGVETGNAELLEKINKGVTYEQMVQAASRVKEAGIPLSVTVILGLGGKEKSLQHARDTSRILSDIDPDYAGALTLMIVPGTPLYEEYIKREFILPDQFGLLNELAIIIEGSNFSNCYFTSNHASNYLPVKARLPQEKESVVRMIHRVIEAGDAECLRPEYLRGL